MNELSAFIRKRVEEHTESLHAEVIAGVERQLVAEVLNHTKGNQVQAARILGITRGTLRIKMRALGISVASSPSVNQRDTLKEQETFPACGVTWISYAAAKDAEENGERESG